MDAYTPRSSEDLLGFIVTIVVDLPTKQNADTVDGPAKSCTTKRMVETHPKSNGMFTTYQLVIRISLAHPQYFL